ncbi:MAG: hypothetical protein CBD97_01680 [Pelagibacteraceae bacterium TMED237]|nr:MAG: hypothetical protein CBD97_01680 [Pelagibacteraceae bacterium TMED237]|tara:strand:- start:16841 stop:17044 length:204 start_codon:yes stop_codon:yes gene_type:complete
MGKVTLSHKDKDKLDMFAAQALSGYIREGLSMVRRKEECLDIAEACYDLASAMLVASKRVEETIETL